VRDVIAIDWSGRSIGARRTIWLAHARVGRLVTLENGRTREEAIEAAIERAGPECLVGLDFSLSFPRWYCEREGWSTGPEVWAAMRERGEALLAACEPPFWGRPGTRAQTLGEPLRQTERAAGARSTFQIGGAGAVGTGAIRGMPLLERLAAAGFAVWPFDAPAARTVVELYPRLLAGAVVKSREDARRAYLRDRFGDEDPGLLERAAGCEDAFDAAVSALVAARHAGALPAVPATVEGRIWTPWRRRSRPQRVGRVERPR
jgi:hypothetical protein